MFERFTDRACRVMVVAHEEGLWLGDSVIGTEHLLLGLLCEGRGVAARALLSRGVSLEGVRQGVVAKRPVSDPATSSPPFTPRAK
jgi:ATP-dependent Clp protease ATP-binding subunit ClpC